MLSVWVLPFLVGAAVCSQFFTQFQLSAPSADFIPDDPVAHTIVSRALKDGIVLSEFAFSGPALHEIVFLSRFNLSQFPPSLLEPGNATTIDVHVHFAPKWYGDIRQDPTESTPFPGRVFARITAHAIRSVFSVPNPNIFLGDENATRAIARLLNEHMAVLARILPRRFSFFATTPLPYVHGAALESLGALGVALTSNHEGRYLGDTLFSSFFSAMEERRSIIFVHPNEPLLEVNQTLVKANPTGLLASRTFLDLAISQTLTNFSNLDFIIPHRSLLDNVMTALRTRCWWDSAGLTYEHQLGGLLAYNISPDYLLIGSDYPYVPSSLVTVAFEAITASPFLNEQQKRKVRNENAQRLFGGGDRREAV
ncbi:hypothetical protein FB451DRAFT_1182182 [Mycena latifolia]|nr:hypothetical protein FB451DRAFT_1182182 [Mycena latifolia]